jgi:hypothetical protein
MVNRRAIFGSLITAATERVAGLPPQMEIVRQNEVANARLD